MKKLIFLLGLTCIVIPALAYRIEYGNNLVISSPVHENLYISGGTVTINAPIYGDLVIAGGTITINDSVSKDVLVAGGNITLNGVVGEDLRCAGGDIRISKDVLGEIIIAGGRIVLNRGATAGAVIATGGNISIDGNTLGDLKASGGELVLNGMAARDVDYRGGKITINGNIGGSTILAASNIVLGSQAVFNNGVRYWNNAGKLDFRQTVKNGSTVYDPTLSIDTGKWYYLGAATILGLLWYLGMALLMIAIIEYLFAATMRRSANTIYNSTGKSFLYGLIFFIGMPVAAVLSFITIIGVPVGLLLIFFYVTLLLLATVITSILAANWLNNRNQYGWNYWKIVWVSFAIFIGLKLLAAIAFAGPLLVAVSVLICFGALLLNVSWKRNTAMQLSDVPLRAESQL